MTHWSDPLGLAVILRRSLCRLRNHVRGGSLLWMRTGPDEIACARCADRIVIPEVGPAGRCI